MHFFVSDHHFDHANMLKFTREDGSPVRPGFSSLEEMNEEMIRRHNDVVEPQDKVYFLGDVSMGNDVCKHVRRMNGRKTLILGNHDVKKPDEYLACFERIFSGRNYGLKGLSRAVFLCHYPIYKHANDRGVCIHGHVHYRTVDDPRYLNVSVENIDYTPISFDQVVEYFKEREINILK